MEERKSLMLKILAESKRKRATTMVTLYEKKVKDFQLHIDRMKKIIFDTQNS
jgi:hypothetical protein